MSDTNSLSVKEFADATGRFPNQIYDLINKGNQYRKLKCFPDKVTGKKRIPSSEITQFPFTPADKLRIELAARLSTVEGQLRELENSFEKRLRNIERYAEQLEEIINRRLSQR